MSNFQSDIRALFREMDREQMEWAFDLWSHSDVKANAGAILERLTLGEMPCDQPWTPEKIGLFRSWVDEGCPE